MENKIEVEFEGKKYLFYKSRWLENYQSIPTILSDKLSSKFSHLIEYNIDDYKGPADIEIFGGDLNILKDAFLKAFKLDQNNQIYHAILCSILRKQNQPLKALNYGSDDSNNEAVLSSRAAAYSDIGELDKAEKNAKRAYGFNKNRKATESQKSGLNYIRNVFNRIDKLRKAKK